MKQKENILISNLDGGSQTDKKEYQYLFHSEEKQKELDLINNRNYAKTSSSTT